MNKLKKKYHFMDYIYEEMDKAFDYNQEIKKRYYSIGNYEGKEEGEKAATKRMIKSLYAKKMPLSFISEVTKLDEKSVKEMLKT